MVLLDDEKDYRVEELGDIINLIRENCSDGFREGRQEIHNKVKGDYPEELIDLTFFTLDTIIFIDILAFNGYGIRNNPKIARRGKFTAFYNNADDTYGVTFSKVNNLCHQKDVVNIKEDRDIEYLGSTVEANVLGLAIHEVRHRLQHKHKLRMFTRNTRTRNSRINDFILYQTCLFDENKKMNFKKTRSRRFTSARNSPTEFDASFIEAYFLAETAKKKTFNLSEIREMVFLDPILLFNKMENNSLL